MNMPTSTAQKRLTKKWLEPNEHDQDTAEFYDHLSGTVHCIGSSDDGRKKHDVSAISSEGTKLIQSGSRSNQIWGKLRNAVKENARMKKKNTLKDSEHLVDRAKILTKLVQEVDVDHSISEGRRIQFDLALPDYTENSLPTKCAIESQMKSHKKIVESAVKGVNTQPPDALHWMLKKTKERMIDKLPGYDVCKTIKHHHTRDQLIAIKRHQERHEKRIQRAKKCVTSHHQDSFVLLHLRNAKRKRRANRRRDRSSPWSEYGRKKQANSLFGTREESLVLPAMEAKLFTNVDDTTLLLSQSLRSNRDETQFPAAQRQRRKRRHGHKKKKEKDVQRGQAFLTREEYKTMSNETRSEAFFPDISLEQRSPTERPKKSAVRSRSEAALLSSTLAPLSASIIDENGEKSPESSEKPPEVDNMLRDFGNLSMAEKQKYLRLMREELMSRPPRMAQEENIGRKNRQMPPSNIQSGRSSDRRIKRRS